MGISSYAARGQVLEYRESGDKLMVEVLQAKDTLSGEGRGSGEEYKLKVLEVLAGSESSEVGSEFTVWRAKEGHPQFGSWYFVDR